MFSDSAPVQSPARRSHGRVLRHHLSLFVLLSVPLACVRTAAEPRALSVSIGQATPLPLISWQRDYGTFWDALSNLDLDYGTVHPVDDEQRRLAAAFGMILTGQVAAAESSLGNLYRSTHDTLLRTRARTTLTGVLQYESKWAALFALQQDSAHWQSSSDSDAASVAVWSKSLAHAPPERVTYRGDASSASMTLSPFGTPVVEVRVNGRTRHFWLDTGASMTMFASDVASQCGVHPTVPDTLEVVTATGRIAAQPAVVDRFEAGPLVLANHPAMIVDEAALQLVRPGPHSDEFIKIDGIIGMNAIRHLDVTLDYSNTRIVMRQPKPESSTVERNLFWLGFPVVRLFTPAGNVVHFGLDTGADGTFATPSLLTKVDVGSLITEKRNIHGLGGGKETTLHLVRDLRVMVGDHQLRFRNLLLSAPRKLTFINLDGMLGSDLGKSGAVRIDMTNGVFAVMKPPSSR